MPVVKVLPLRLVAVAAPSVGVTNVGDVEKTKLVEVVPVDPAALKPVILLKQVIVADVQLVPPLLTGRAVVNALAKFAPLGVARNVATPVPSPDTPVAIGKPVALVRVPLEGVPSAPPLVTNAPAEPTLIPSAVATPVPGVTNEREPNAPPAPEEVMAEPAPMDKSVEPIK